MKKILLLIGVGVTFIVSLKLACPDSSGWIRCYYFDKDEVSQEYDISQSVGTCWSAPHGLYGCWTCNPQAVTILCKHAVSSAQNFKSYNHTEVRASGAFASWTTDIDANGNIIHTDPI